MEVLHETIFKEDVSLNSLRHEMAVFANERGWEKFHTPRNLLLALTGEVGELCEIFQWRGECGHLCALSWSEKDRVHLGEELSDVLLYLLRLADRSGVDLALAAKRKLELNRKKYPVEKCFGSSKKYSEYSSGDDAAVSVTDAVVVETCGEMVGNVKFGADSETANNSTRTVTTPKSSPTERLRIAANLSEAFGATNRLESSTSSSLFSVGIAPGILITLGLGVVAAFALSLAKLKIVNK